jgi:hypothetical protein
MPYPDDTCVAMILPLADESVPAERVPWVTLGLLAACLAGFVAAGGLQRIFVGPPGVELEQAVDYWLEHPYLEAPPAVVDAAAAAEGASDSVAFIARTRARGALPPFNDASLSRSRASWRITRAWRCAGRTRSRGPSIRSASAAWSRARLARTRS